MKFIFLGTGTSTGIPQIGCGCATCKSTNTKDKRLRASMYIEFNDTTKVLIDCGPDLRQQLLTENINELSGVLLTHEHYDHIGGLDDVRPLGELKVYAESNVISVIERNMPYCFAENRYPGVPSITLKQIQLEKFYIKNNAIQPVRIMHAKLPILGYRIGNFAYLTDVKTIDDNSMKLLMGLDILVINALRYKEHISHLNLEQAIDISNKINAKKTYFTHLSHDMGLHDEVSLKLPNSFHIAYDGLVLSL